MPLPSLPSVKTPYRPFFKLAVLAVGTACALPGQAQQSFATFADFEAAALAALNSESLTRLEFTANGWEGCLGQPWRIDAGWARWELTGYTRVLDFDAGMSVHSAQRRAGLDPDRIGGCGAQPSAAATPQQSSITPQSPWANQLTLWLTPQGFLELAEDNNATVAADNGGWTVSFTKTDGTVNYPFSGYFNAELLPERIETRIDNTVFGDMLVEAEFSDYRDFGGVRFPAHLVHKQGGFAVLDLMIDGVTPNTTASAEAPARPGGGPGGPGGGGGGQAPALPTGVSEVGPGIFVSHGAYQGVFVEFDGYSVVIDGLQSDARAAELIAQVKEAIPGKPIRYVITTHNHFDHASGLRAFVAEGATIITHNVNVDFFKEALSSPRTLQNPDPQALPVEVMGVGDMFVLSDETQQIQLHRLVGDTHADDMLIAYLPSIKAVVEADILQHWIGAQFGGNYEGGHPFLHLLADELDRLGLDYTQFIPVHRPPQPPFQGKAELMTAIGRTE